MDNTRLALLEFHWSYIRDAKKMALYLKEPSPTKPLTDNYKNREAFNKCFLAQIK